MPDDNRPTHFPLERRPTAQGSLLSPSMTKKALLLVDVQKGFWSDSLRQLFPNFEENITSLLQRARSSPSSLAGRLQGTGGTASASCGSFIVDHIVHIHAAYRTDHPRFSWPAEFSRLNPDKSLVLADTPAAASTAFAKPLADDLVDNQVVGRREFLVKKPTFDAFLGTDLEDLLRSLQVTEVLVCGLVTSACVQATAHGAYARGFRVTLLEDCCADRSVERHEAVLALYGGYMYQIATWSLVESTTSSKEAVAGHDQQGGGNYANKSRARIIGDEGDETKGGVGSSDERRGEIRVGQEAEMA